jgi:hypothetical protein
MRFVLCYFISAISVLAQSTPVSSAVSALASSNAVSSFAFGPQKFDRSHGSPVPQEVTFTVPALVDGPFTIIVQNGHGHSRVDSGLISLNGTVLVDDQSFPKDTFQAPVTLASDNTLEIELNGTDDGEITVSIVGYSYAFSSDYASLPLVTTPGSDDIDWRAKGAVTGVVNEGSCHADWAFSATGVVEGFTAINTGTLPHLSAQQLIDCTPPASKCADASPARALTNVIAKQSGEMASTASYPYTAKVGKCKAFSSPAATISGLTRSSDEGGLANQLESQPVSVVFNGNFLSSYVSGVVNPASCGTEPPQYQAGLVVGSISSPSAYWIIRTSLGTTFGSAGYVYIAKGTNCGIGNYAITAH